jgi:hypothetical protein
MEGRLVPATNYTLSIATDFGGSFDSEGWVKEIGDSSIATLIDHGAGGVTMHGDVLETWFADVLSVADAVTFNALPAGHYPLWREPIMRQITDKREYRLANVIFAEYPASSGLMFGVGTADQDNWNKLISLDGLGFVTYPFPTYTYDHADSHNLVDSADLAGAVAAISVTVLTERMLADGYLNAVVAATTEVEAIAAAAPYLEL